MIDNAFKQMLMRHEGLRLKPYMDTVGKLTIGYGRNLDDNGITEQEAEVLLDSDISRAMADLERIFPISNMVSDQRYHVLVNMMFNLGASRLMGFKRMWGALAIDDYEAAADEMLDSLWADQVGRRAIELADIMRHNKISP